jgi:hypothetical protein
LFSYPVLTDSVKATKSKADEYFEKDYSHALPSGATHPKDPVIGTAASPAKPNQNPKS